MRPLTLLLIVCTTPAGAQLVASQAEDRTFVYRMTVRPAEQPEPLLRYRLIHSDYELTEGNAAPFWYRAMLDWQRDRRRIAEQIAEQLIEADGPDAYPDRSPIVVGLDALDEWGYPRDTPLNEIPLKLAREATEDALGWRRTQMLEAARRGQCDWGLGVKRLRGPDSINFLLPEFQEMRSLSRVLCLDIRVAIAEGRLDDALSGLQLNTELARDAAEGPFLVCDLVGWAICGLGWDAMRDLMCHQDAPSLYWALADLPRPVFDHWETIRYESALGFRLYELIRDPVTTDRTEDEWRRLYVECLDSLTEIGAPCEGCNPKPRADEDAKKLMAWIDGLRHADRDHPGADLAMRRLIDRGFDKSRLDRMPVAQILAIDAEHVYRTLLDRIELAFRLPWIESQDTRNEAWGALGDADPLGESPTREVLPIATITSAAMPDANRGLVARERDLDALRLVEALRLHAGVAGKLPTALDEVTIVPVPLNPATGKPFAYRLDGKTAIIDLPKSDGVVWVERYEVTLAE